MAFCNFRVENSFGGLPGGNGFLDLLGWRMFLGLTKLQRLRTALETVVYTMGAAGIGIGGGRKGGEFGSSN